MLALVDRVLRVHLRCEGVVLRGSVVLTAHSGDIADDRIGNRLKRGGHNRTLGELFRLRESALPKKLDGTERIGRRGRHAAWWRRRVMRLRLRCRPTGARLALLHREDSVVACSPKRVAERLIGSSDPDEVLRRIGLVVAIGMEFEHEPSIGGSAVDRRLGCRRPWRSGPRRAFHSDSSRSTALPRHRELDELAMRREVDVLANSFEDFDGDVGSPFQEAADHVLDEGLGRRCAASGVDAPLVMPTFG